MSSDGDRLPIQVWTDGAALGNPGPAGLGVVLVCGGRRKEISEALGHTTNNVAELTAVQRGLEAVKDRSRTVIVHSDSTYVLGVLGRGWKARANRELVREIRELAARFADLRWRKVPAHAGVADNERCDRLAKEAARRAG